MSSHWKELSPVGYGSSLNFFRSPELGSPDKVRTDPQKEKVLSQTQSGKKVKNTTTTLGTSKDKKIFGPEKKDCRKTNTTGEVYCKEQVSRKF